MCTQTQTHWGPTRSHLHEWSVTWSVGITATLGPSCSHIIRLSLIRRAHPSPRQPCPWQGCVQTRGRLSVAFPQPYWQASAGSPICCGARKLGQARAGGHVTPSVGWKPCQAPRTVRVVCGEASGGAHGPCPKKEASRSSQPCLNLWALCSGGTGKELGDQGGTWRECPVLGRGDAGLV